jgi:hypothetical protein
MFLHAEDSVVMISKDHNEIMGRKLESDRNYTILTDPIKAAEGKAPKLIKKSRIAGEVVKTLI